MFGKIIGTGSYAPDNVVCNNDLKEFFETDDQWIRERTGIKRRHIMTDESTSYGVQGGRKGNRECRNKL